MTCRMCTTTGSRMRRKTKSRGFYAVFILRRVVENQEIGYNILIKDEWWEVYDYTISY